jgi:hypothetical protein
LNKIFGIFNRIAVIKENKATHTYENKFAGELIKACMDSGTARICIERRASYIYGDGFADENVAKMQANKTETFNKFFASAAQYPALLKAVCFKVLVDNTGNPYRIYNIPVDKVERSDKGTFLYNATKNTDNYDRNKDTYYDEYNPNLTPTQRVEELKKELAHNKGKQKGKFVYVFNKGIGQEYYAVPPAYSGLEDIKTDSELSSYELENLENGFLPSAILTLIGKLDDTVKDEKTGKTEADFLKDKLSAFTAKQGGRSKLLVLTADTKEGLPNLQQLDAGTILNGLDAITERVGRKVCRLFEVPPVLAGFQDASILGSNQTFKNSLVSLQHSVLKDQELITEALNMVYPELDFTIKQLKLVDYIPDSVMAKLTDEEIRELYGYTSIEKATPSSQQQILDTLNSMSPLVANKILSSMSKSQILSLVGIQEEEVDTTLIPAPDATTI